MRLRQQSDVCSRLGPSAVELAPLAMSMFGLRPAENARCVVEARLGPGSARPVRAAGNAMRLRYDVPGLGGTGVRPDPSHARPMPATSQDPCDQEEQEGTHPQAWSMLMGKVQEREPFRLAIPVRPKTCFGQAPGMARQIRSTPINSAAELGSQLVEIASTRTRVVQKRPGRKEVTDASEHEKTYCQLPTHCVRRVSW